MGHTGCSRIHATVLACLASGCGVGNEETPRPTELPPPFAGELRPAPANVPVATVDDENSPSVDFGVSDVSDEPMGEIGAVCAAQTAASELRRVFLAFAFDVSASMGGNNETRYNAKWLPVVAASAGFFAEAEAAAISASLTFFPSADEPSRCTDAAYLTPDVPMSPLPSPAFAAAISGLQYSLGSNTWRTSTPTLAAFNGTVASLLALPVVSVAEKRVVVMVTDGVPQGCDGVNDAQLVADAVRNSGIQTFVVGVANPPGDNGGDNLANLNAIAVAGGTESAFIVTTGDPAQTEADFKAVVDRIRGIAVSCTIEIPLPPAGTEFIPDQVNVSYGSDAGIVRLAYDADCLQRDTWRFDDPIDPISIVLCDDTCTQVQQDVTASLNVEFGCSRRGDPH